MAQPAAKSIDVELLSLLKIDNKGWNIDLFQDTNKISNCLCAHCGCVCCDAVELGCEHEDDDIFLYCKQCLTHLINDNHNKCIVNSHNNPQLTMVRAMRRQISKSIVICPYSTQYKMRNVLQKNENGQIMDTIGGEEKEGGQQIIAAAAKQQPRKQILMNENKSGNECEWNGILNDLIKKHISICANKNNPTFALNIKIKYLENENIELKKENEKVINELNNKNRENNELKLAMNEKEVIIVELNKEMNKQKLANENTINKLNAKIKNKINESNIENNKLREFIKAKEALIVKLSTKITKHSLFVNKEKEEKKENERNNKSILKKIKGNQYCTLDLNNQIFTTKGINNTYTKTYAIIDTAWSKHTNEGIHEFKLKCLQSAGNEISIGMVTNNKVKMNDNTKWLFDDKECGISYQLYVGNCDAIYHHKYGTQKYKESLPQRKAICSEWKWNNYGPNETMSVKVNFSKSELLFCINGKTVGKTIKIDTNIYYPAIAYTVWNNGFSRYGALKIKVLSLY